MRKAGKLLSYFSPITVETASSDHNNYLEVQQAGGKYVLNSGSSNYSYGSLHTLFKRTFRRLRINWKNVSDALILGYGTGCVAETIIKYNPSCRITGVEIDGKIIELGNKYFRKEILNSVTVHNCSAEEFIVSCNSTYDLVIVDVYIGKDVPDNVQSEDFLLNVRRSLRKGGMIIFNKYVYSRKTTGDIPVLKERFLRIFGNLNVMRVMLTGRMFVSGKTTE